MAVTNDLPPVSSTQPLRRRPRRRMALGVVVGLALGAVGLGVTGTPAAAACSISTSVRLGARGDAVRCVQQTLAAAGYATGPVDGSFGSVTHRAVVQFQSRNGLAADGLVGPQTAGAMGIWGTASAPSTPAPSTPSSPAGCTISSTLRAGASGSSVRCLQQAVAAAGFSPGPVDGAFGNQTRAAVSSYQRANGLTVDGVVGRQTGTALGIWAAAGTPPPATAGSPGSSGSSGSSACTVPAHVPAGARQLVVVDSTGSWANVDLLVHDGARWVCVRENMQARVGRNGVRALADRRSGDGTTPAGTFGLGTMTAPDGQTFQFFGNGTNPGVQGSWRQVKQRDCWVATPGDPAYNTLADRSAGNCNGEDEYLPDYRNSYSQAALIDANMGPNRSGDDPGEPALAAAIFLHRQSYGSAGISKATAGCVSLDSNDLATVLRVLRPGEAYFVIR